MEGGGNLGEAVQHERVHRYTVVYSRRMLLSGICLFWYTRSQRQPVGADHVPGVPELVVYIPVQVRRYLLGPASNLQAGPAKYRTTTARGMSKNWGSAAVQFRVIPNARMWHRLAALAACACACVCGRHGQTPQSC